MIANRPLTAIVAHNYIEEWIAMRTQSLGWEAELIGYGFYASLRDGAAACDFVAKLGELQSVAQGFQLKEVTSDQPSREATARQASDY